MTIIKRTKTITLTCLFPLVVLMPGCVVDDGTGAQPRYPKGSDPGRTAKLDPGAPPTTPPPAAAPGTPPHAPPPGKTHPRTPPPPAAGTAVSPRVTCPAGGRWGPARWARGTGHLRRYISETRLNLVRSTKATPVEVCGFRAKVRWLMRARCPNGMPPFRTGRQAFRARRGNVGGGGRCRTIVDLYNVPCGKKIFQVYMDAYQCLPGERWP